MPDLATLLPAAYTALLGVGPPVRIDADDSPGTPEVIVLALVSDTSRPAYGGTPTDTLIQVSVYAETTLRALQLDTLARAALAPVGLTHVQMRPAPDPDSLGYISDFTS